MESIASQAIEAKDLIGVKSQILSAIVGEYWMHELSGIKQPFAEFLRILETPGAPSPMGQISMVDFSIGIILAF